MHLTGMPAMRRLGANDIPVKVGNSVLDVSTGSL